MISQTDAYILAAIRAGAENARRVADLPELRDELRNETNDSRSTMQVGHVVNRLRHFSNWNFITVAADTGHLALTTAGSETLRVWERENRPVSIRSPMPYPPANGLAAILRLLDANAVMELRANGPDLVVRTHIGDKHYQHAIAPTAIINDDQIQLDRAFCRTWDAFAKERLCK